MGKSALQGKQFKYIKGGMHVLNFFVATLGLALGGVGLWIRVDFKENRYRQVIDPVFALCGDVDKEFDFNINTHMDAIAYFLIFLGVAILCIGGIGACGTIRERQTYIGIFCILLFIVFAVLLTSGIQAMEKKDSFVMCEANLTEGLQKAVNEYNTVSSQRQFLDRVQTYVMCCGASKGPADYVEIDPPTSCLRNATDVDSTDYFTTTCDSAIKKFFSSVTNNMITILAVSSCLGLFTIIGIGMSAYLFMSLRTAKLV